jgi:HEAT repeat protein
MGAEARPAEAAVIKRLSDPIPELRVRATLVFEDIGSTSKNAVAPLMANLTAPQDPVRQGAASALGNIGADAKDAAVPLIECLLDSDPFVRYFAALSLGRIGSTDAAIVPALREALDDPSPQVRLGAVDSLMRLNRRWTAEAEPILLALSRPPHDLDTRIRAIDGLVTIAPEKAKPALPLLHSELNGPSAAIRLRAVSLLKRIEPERTSHLVLVLMAALRMADPNVRGPIAQELGKLGGKARAAIPSLQRVYQFDIPSVRKEAAKALRAVDAQTAKRIGIE